MSDRLCMPSNGSLSVAFVVKVVQQVVHVVHSCNSNWLLAQTGSDGFERLPFWVINEKKKWSPTTNVCLRSLRRRGSFCKLTNQNKLGSLGRGTFKKQERKRPVSLAQHKDWKREETAGLSLSKGRKIHLPASSLINTLCYVCLISTKNKVGSHCWPSPKVSTGCLATSWWWQDSRTTTWCFNLFVKIQQTRYNMLISEI